MVLYALCPHPLIQSMVENLPGLQMERAPQFLPVLAYADDVTVFVTQPAGFTRYMRQFDAWKRQKGLVSTPQHRKQWQ